MQVYTVDLLKFRKEDLFTVELKPQTISVRTCEAPLRKALANGTAEYLGWLVIDDELLIDTSSFDTSGIVRLREEYGQVNRWRLAGFNSITQMILRPLYLSKEGLKPDVDPEIKKIIDNRGWLVTVNKLFSTSHVKIIRRDALGRPRLYSAAHLPICWEVK